jgi:hypothetical protein
MWAARIALDEVGGGDVAHGLRTSALPSPADERRFAMKKKGKKEKGPKKGK